MGGIMNILWVSCLLLLRPIQGEMSNQLVEQLIKDMNVKIAEMEVKNQEIEAKIEEVTKENNSLKTRVEELTKQDEAVTSQMSAVQSSLSTALSPREFQMIYTCGYKLQWSKAGSTITYDTLTTDFNNADRPGGADGAQSRLDSGESVGISLFLNGE